MAFNIIIGFLIPWILGIYIYMKEKRLFIIIYPFGCTVSYTIHMIGFQLRWWVMKPYEYGIFASFPTNLGLYPIIGTYFVMLVYEKMCNSYYLLLIFSLLTTAFEYLMLVLKRGVYGNGWNLFWTFASYLIAYSLGYLFYHIVIRKEILL